MLDIRKTAELINLEPSEKLFAEIFPIDGLSTTMRYANRSQSIRIYIKNERFEMISGGIIMWHGSLASIPPDYALCDGTSGTPDLRDRFVVGTAVGVDPGGVGGNVNHNHTFTGDGHFHGLGAGFGLTTGPDRNSITTTNPAVGTTDNADGRPPFYEIAYIMKL